MPALVASALLLVRRVESGGPGGSARIGSQRIQAGFLHCVQDCAGAANTAVVAGRRSVRDGSQVIPTQSMDPGRLNRESRDDLDGDELVDVYSVDAIGCFGPGFPGLYDGAGRRVAFVSSNRTCFEVDDGRQNPGDVGLPGMPCLCSRS